MKLEPLNLNILRYFGLEDQQRLLELLDRTIKKDDPMRQRFEMAAESMKQAVLDEYRRDEEMFDHLVQEHMGRSFYQYDDSRVEYESRVFF
jgi:hypothetical protein